MSNRKACRCNEPLAPEIVVDFATGSAIGNIKRCSWCHGYCSLGPANDTPEVLVEVRSAEIAAHADPGQMARAEWNGWTGPLLVGDYDGDAHQAGYLARIIYDHDAEQRRLATEAVSKLTDADFARMGVPTPRRLP